ncbi:hypothetical protein B6D16_00925 [Gilliamella apicola]|uniref:hypothetical protein n=1 Tax=Gilliamella apicola TaxID=1196095 RepID=UPI000A346008|nr:hypothetical protein [Gilliamella apicola]OTP97247.1 hypothetical protein B6D05_01760 [Gilliamella apicola]OTQ19266.1 hypothetical protein B6D15_02385 [Gilliamella apicola]OTQ21677.1 hypothetical protein B6D16_00925 [Gilliamella apicola]OTQ22984.1 hypothetical protein B6D04_10765 [Gilliamella apicola]
MNDLEQLETIDERIAEAERVLNFLHEQRREIINRSNLNKNDSNVHDSNVVVSSFLSTSYR